MTRVSWKRIRHLRRREEEWSMRAMDAEERHGQDSPRERRALERATDYQVEADVFCPDCAYSIDLHDGQRCPTETEARVAWGER